jgi:hypothetical protein
MDDCADVASEAARVEFHLARERGGRELAEVDALDHGSLLRWEHLGSFNDSLDEVSAMDAAKVGGVGGGEVRIVRGGIVRKWLAQYQLNGARGGVSARHGDTPAFITNHYPIGSSLSCEQRV